MNRVEIKLFLKENKINSFLSLNLEKNNKFLKKISKKIKLKGKFELPLTILFINGEYFIHYEKIIFKEMIRSDINKIFKK